MKTRSVCETFKEEERRGEERNGRRKFEERVGALMVGDIGCLWG